MPRRRTTTPPPQATGNATNCPPPSWWRRNWKRVAGWSAGFIIFLILVSTLTRPSERIVAAPGEDFTTIKKVSLKGGETHSIPVPPGHRVDYWAQGVSEHWSERGVEVVLTLSAEKETEVKYRVYLCTTLTPCHSERPKLTEEEKEIEEKTSDTHDPDGDV